MNNLLDKLASQFDEAEGLIRIVDADWYADDLRLSLSISMCEDSEPELWEVICVGVVEESINSNGEETCSLSTESPLLIPYCETEVNLMFSENSCDPALLFGLVASACVEVLGRVGYLHRFLNLEPTISGIASSKYGTLGQFPKTLANRIVQMLSGQPIRVNPIDSGLPKLWTGTEFVNYPPLVAFELGSSYVIGENFSAERA